MASAMVAAGSTGLFVDLASTQNSTNTTTLTISSPASVQAGDLLVSIIGIGGYNYNSLWTCPAGWTERVDEGDAPNICVSTLVATDPGSVAYTWNTAQAFRTGGVILVYRGAELDVVGTIAHAANGGAITVPSVTTSAADCAVIMACLDVASSVTYPDISGWVDRAVQTISLSWRIREKVFTSAGATGTFSVNSSATANDNAGLLISIKPA